MASARVPIVWRDTCAGVLIPLNECRRKSFFLPWKCEDERLAYEKCQYVAYKARLINKPEGAEH